MKKVMITPYFGELPPWFEKFKENFEATLRPAGYDWILDTDLEGFKKRVKDKLGIEFPGTWGSPKVWDYRGSLGYLYSEEIHNYEWWGTCDFDMIFGDVNKWASDEVLADLDVYSGHNTYVCGCWTLYRNVPEVNELFMKFNGWKEKLEEERASGWIEQEYSRELEGSGLRYVYTFNQGYPWTKTPNISFDRKRLFQDGGEIMFFHFRHSKRWPIHEENKTDTK